MSVLRSVPLGALIACGIPGCGGQDAGAEPTGLEQLQLTDVQPRQVVPGTLLTLSGASFLGAPLGVGSLRLQGTFDGRAVDATIPASFEDYDRMSVIMSRSAISLLGSDSGKFSGSASVTYVYTPDGSQHASFPIPLALEIEPELTPELSGVDSGGTIFVNDKIDLEASGLLFGGEEGESFAVVEGCYTPVDGTECQSVGPTDVPVSLTDPTSREDGAFPFSPRIAGIFPGSFEGSVTLENRHVDGPTRASDPQDLSFEIAPAQIGEIGGGGSLGQYIDVPGGGFVGGEEGLTILRLVGDYLPDDGVNALPVPGLELLPDFVEGNLVRYVVNESDGLGQALDLRSETGTFNGVVQPVIVFGSDEYEGAETPATFRIEPVKQVVWVKFNQSYVEALRKFGLRALDSRLRERILQVVRRDYETINVELREEEPQDYALFATVDIAGPDVNGLGLWGYDNSPGKDFNNERLFDRIGGVNAETQEDNFPGFGGVFIESIFTFSPHPLQGEPSEVAVPIFDQIFDPFRPDRGGTPISSQDFTGQGIPVLETGGSCPSTDRRLQAACAVWALGSIIGSTVAHELGHSMGLADPVGERFHNLGDAPNRLMDQGGSRSFLERAELMGQGPSRFCVEAYEYLRAILPTNAPMQLEGREHC